MVYFFCSPALTLYGSLVFSTFKSAWVETVVFSVAVLGNTPGSGVRTETTLAVFVMAPAGVLASTSTSMSTLGVANGKTFSSEHVTALSPAEKAHVSPPAPFTTVADWNVTSEGRVSVTRTCSAVEGPRFDTSIW